MGCGLISQKGGGGAVTSASHVDVVHRQPQNHQASHQQHQCQHRTLSESARAVRVPRAADEGNREAAASQSGASSAVRLSLGNNNEQERVLRHRRNDGPREEASITVSGGARRLAGERSTLAGRLAGHIQDHAFCFECGAFFNLGNSRPPCCGNCGSSFVQYLRSAGSEHWISADALAPGTSNSFTFDDQLDTSITTSLQDTPMLKRPTQGAFLKGLPRIQLSAAEVQARGQLAAGDPRHNCSICRDTFNVDDELRRLPCSHEFHDACIITWLGGNNTCPMCRCKLPEAAEDEETDTKDGEPVVRRSKPRSNTTEIDAAPAETEVVPVR